MLLLYNDIYVEALGIEVPNKAVMEDSFDKAGRVVSQGFLFSFFSIFPAFLLNQCFMICFMGEDSTHPLPPPFPDEVFSPPAKHTCSFLSTTVAQSDTVPLSDNGPLQTSQHTWKLGIRIEKTCCDVASKHS